MTNDSEIIINARNRTQQAFNSVNQQFNRMRQSATAVNAALGLLAGGGLSVIATRSARSADEVAKFAATLGISTEALSEFQFVVTQSSNLSKEKFNTAIATMVRRVSEAALGFGAAKKSLAELNIDVGELNRLSPDKQFLLLADAISKTENQADKVRLTVSLFDSGARGLVSTIDQGSDGIENLRQKFRNLGGTLTKEQAKAIENYNDSLAQISEVFSRLGREIVGLISGPLTSFVGFFADSAIPAIRDFLDEINLVERSVVSLSDEQLEAERIETELAIARKQSALALHENATAQQELRFNSAKQAENLREEIKLLKEKLGLIDSTLSSRSVPEELPVINIIAPLHDLGSQPGLDDARQKQQEAQQLISATRTELELYEQQISRVQDLYLQGYIDEEVKNRALGLIDEGFITQQEEYAEQYRYIWSSAFDTLASGTGDAVAAAIFQQKTLEDGMRDVLRNVVSQVISGLVEVFIQQKIIAAAGKALGVKSALSTAKIATVTGSAWAAPAALASLATLGTNSVAASAALTGTVGLSQVLANALSIGSISGIADGGLDFVKNRGTYILERGEGVIKRQDNERIPELLKNINSGSGGPVNVSFNISALDTQSAADVILQNEQNIISIVQRSYSQRGKTGGPIR